MRTATSKLARTSWGLDTAPEAERHWSKRGLCRRAPDLWVYSGTTGEALRALAIAKHLCLNHCPVFAECRNLADTRPAHEFAGTIIAGRYHTHHQGAGSRISEGPPDPGHGTWCWETTGDG